MTIVTDGKTSRSAASRRLLSGSRLLPHAGTHARTHANTHETRGCFHLFSPTTRVTPAFACHPERCTVVTPGRESVERRRRCRSRPARTHNGAESSGNDHIEGRTTHSYRGLLIPGVARARTLFVQEACAVRASSPAARAPFRPRRDSHPLTLSFSLSLFPSPSRSVTSRVVLEQ